MFCSHCEISYYIRWNPRDTGHDDAKDPLDDDGLEEAKELFPEFCPFCGASAEEEL